MRIGIDARWIFPEISGVGRVTEKLIQHLGETDRENTYLLFFSEAEQMARYASRWEPYPNLEPIMVPWRIFSPGNQMRMPAFIRKQKLDIFHSTNYMLPLFLRKTAVISTIHDLIPLKFPHFTPRAKKTRFNYLFRILLSRCARQSDRIITVSSHTRDDLIGDLGISGEKIAVVYNGIDDHYQPLGREDIQTYLKEKLDLSPPYLLYVGRFDPYKNVVELIKAFSLFSRGREDRPTLVLAGHLDPRYPEGPQTVKELEMEDQVVFLNGVDEDDLIHLYNGARGLILASLYEGFGLPPLEAMACGTPVIVSDRGSLPEVVGDAGIIIDPDREDSIAGAIGRLWDSETLRSELREKGLRRAKEFSWEKTARETLRVYEELVGMGEWGDGTSRTGPTRPTGPTSPVSPIKKGPGAGS
ncbi:MAG: glycosyltransferase family 1 protein [Candidatus Auribacterota bacterium]|nr:glycosyltransferase family 1 protein [Candidatus Auribacterota bacterium]